MSKINSIISAMQSKIATALPAYQKLSNAYNTADNAEALLFDGYGVTIGPATQDRMMPGSIGVIRKFDFVLTKEVFATQNDEATKEAAHLELVNDQLAVLTAFELDFSLSGVCLKIEYDSDSGIQFVSNKNDKYLELKTTVSVQYIEAVT